MTKLIIDHTLKVINVRPNTGGYELIALPMEVFNSDNIPLTWNDFCDHNVPNSIPYFILTAEVIYNDVLMVVSLVTNGNTAWCVIDNKLIPVKLNNSQLCTIELIINDIVKFQLYK